MKALWISSLKVKRNHLASGSKNLCWLLLWLLLSSSQCLMRHLLLADLVEELGDVLPPWVDLHQGLQLQEPPLLELRQHHVLQTTIMSVLDLQSPFSQVMDMVSRHSGALVDMEESALVFQTGTLAYLSGNLFWEKFRDNKCSKDNLIWLSSRPLIKLKSNNCNKNFSSRTLRSLFWTLRLKHLVKMQK